MLDFQRNALEAVNEILGRGRLPIIVGGTNYYIESLLWSTLLGNEPDPEEMDLTSRPREEGDDQHQELAPENIPDSLDELLRLPKFNYRSLKQVPSELLYQFLMELDPEFAHQYHESNRRKIIRALQIYHQTGRKMSDLLAEQRGQVAGSRHGGPLRFKSAILFWLDCERTGKFLNPKPEN